VTTLGETFAATVAGASPSVTVAVSVLAVVAVAVVTVPGSSMR
jgi:hypothetical protein